MSSQMVEAPPGVWGELVGQQRAVGVLRRAVDDDRTGGGHAMTHAWLVTGPPGSGRSNAARAFAAALQCPERGCGHCQVCRTCLTGAHPDVTWVRTEQLSIGVDEIRELVRNASMAPTVGRRQIIIIEDADRITDRGVGGLLKAIEEPAARTVWMLCAPTPDDVIVTIRSRCRSLNLVTPDADAVARLLVDRDGIDPSLAWHAAKIAQGHIGRAKRLATDEQSRLTRRRILELPGKLVDLPACLQAAQNVVTSAEEQAARITGELDAAESAELSQALGLGAKGTKSVGTRGASSRTAQAALKDLEDQQKMRAKRLVRDELDRVITELITYYRDVFTIQLGADSATGQTGADYTAGQLGADERIGRVINVDLRDELTARARASTPETTLMCVDALLHARKAIMTSVAPLLAMESMFIGLARPGDSLTGSRVDPRCGAND